MFDFFSNNKYFGKFINTVYFIVITNLLWIVFSVPIFTIGASTTAMYYVIRKVKNDEDIHVLKDFWKSFKMNFKQASLIWIPLFIAGLIISVDMQSVHLMGKISVVFLPILIALLFELFFVAIYIFPLLSRYYLSTKELFRQAFLISNRHFLRTLICIFILVVLYLLLYIAPVLIFAVFGLYIYFSYYIIHPIFRIYGPDEERKVEEEFVEEVEVRKDEDRLE